MRKKSGEEERREERRGERGKGEEKRKEKKRREETRKKKREEEGREEKTGEEKKREEKEKETLCFWMGLSLLKIRNGTQNHSQHPPKVVLVEARIDFRLENRFSLRREPIST